MFNSCRFCSPCASRGEAMCRRYTISNGQAASNTCFAVKRIALSGGLESGEIINPVPISLNFPDPSCCSCGVVGVSMDIRTARQVLGTALASIRNTGPNSKTANHAYRKLRRICPPFSRETPCMGTRFANMITAKLLRASLPAERIKASKTAPLARAKNKACFFRRFVLEWFS